MLVSVETFATQRGSVRYVARDTDGNEYTTFREDIGERARRLAGGRVRIEYHEETRGRYHNTYLDGISESGPRPAGPAGSGPGPGPAGPGTDPQEAAWRTAVEAAPWLVGQPEQAVPPQRLYDKLKPFEERVAADIEEAQRDRPAGDD